MKAYFMHDNVLKSIFSEDLNYFGIEDNTSLVQDSIYALKANSSLLVISGRDEKIQSVNFHVIVIFPLIDDSIIEGFISILHMRVSSTSLICCLQRNKLIVMENQDGARLTFHEIVELCGGIIQSYELKIANTLEEGFLIIQNEMRKDMQDNGFLEELAQGAADLSPLEKIDYLFHEYFKSGYSINLNSNDRLPPSISEIDKLEIMYSIEKFFKYPLSPQKKQRYYPSIFWSKSCSKLYIVPYLHPSLHLIYKWNQLIHYINFGLKK